MKNTKKTRFIIDEKTYMIVFHRAEDHDLNCCFDDSIIFINGTVRTKLTYGSVYYNLDQLMSLLKKVLDNELMLHVDIKKDLGYLFNEYSAIICGEKKESSDLVYLQKNNDSYWPGIDYSLWSTSISSWIYNKPDGSIIFEITPFYPYMYSEPEEEPNYIPYEEWIKAYKPYFSATLSRDVAHNWLEQAERIIRIIESNQERWRTQSKINVQS